MTMTFAPTAAIDQYDAATSTMVDEGVHLDVVPHQQWDREISFFADASYDQTTVFAASKWGPERVAACRVMHRGDLIGGAVAAHLTVPPLATGIYYVKFGPLWRRCGAAPAYWNYERVVRALRREFCDNRASLLTIVPRPNPDFAAREAELLIGAGFRVDEPAPDPNRYLVDLTADDPLAALSQKWRYNLKRARKEGLCVQELGPVEGYKAFASLHRIMVARKAFACDDTVEVVPQFAAALPAELVPKVYLTYAGERPVAGAVVGKTGDMAHYLYGASSEEGLARHAGYLLQWHILERLRGSEQRWYDLGGEAFEPGLRQFKRGLVGRQGQIFETPGEFSCWTRPGAKWLRTAARVARSARRPMRRLIHRFT